MKIFLFIAILTICLSYKTDAQDVPRVISYQGVLVDASGKPEGGTKTLSFSLKERPGSPVISWNETIPNIQLNGGLFSVPLGINSIPKGFPTLDGEYELLVSIDEVNYSVPLYSSVSALNIADNIVTSAKIKDGEVDLVDLKPGTTIGEILKWDGIKWTRSEDEGLRTVSVNSPITGSGVSGDPLRVSIPLGVPVGTIVAFYGDITNTSEIPDGWLLCDGSAIPNGNEYEKISQICQKNGHAGFTPDLRGQFLRGTGITFQKPINNPDPNFSDRTGGSLVFKVGSVQTDAFQGHRHYIQNYTAPGGGYGIMFNYFSRNGNGEVGGKSLNEAYDIKSDANDEGVGPSGTPRTSSETRPKNVYVNYIIKVK